MDLRAFINPSFQRTFALLLSSSNYASRGQTYPTVPFSACSRWAVAGNNKFARQPKYSQVRPGTRGPRVRARGDDCPWTSDPPSASLHRPFNSPMISTVLQVAPICVDAAQVIAQFAPVPWLAPAVSLVATLMNMIDQAQANKEAMNQLPERCIGFLKILREKGERIPEEQRGLVADAESTLASVISLIKKWCSKNRLELFIKQRALAGVIQDCCQKIDDSMKRLHLSLALDDAAWRADLEKTVERGQKEIMAYLSNIANRVPIIEMAQQLPGDEKTAVMGKMQEMLPAYSAQDTAGLGNNLYGIQESTKSLLPSMHLRFQGEIQLIGEPVHRTPTVDIWEGLYLNEKKVAIKMLRTVHASPRSLQLFQREVEVWKKVWDIDQGRRILPLYGFSQHDGSFPYVISPWPENGTADEYVKRVPQTDHIALIRGICSGICVLHTMTPTIVHGEVRGSNVVIDGSGNPLIANFGFSRIVQDAQGVAITHTVGQDFARWMAPELSSEEGGNLTTSADIYAFGMTMLELMTHKKPWATVNASHQVILKTSMGKKPARPRDAEVVARGLDDRLWAIMFECWDQEGSLRPSATELLQMLEGLYNCNS